jgi:chromosome segregation ATPase
MMGAVGVSFSPLGRAIARRIGGEERQSGTPADVVAELEGLREEIATLRQELDEVHNRLDFAERVLAQAKTRDALPGGR